MLYSQDYRNRVSKEQFVASYKRAYEANKKALKVITYVRATVDGKKAVLFYRHIGTNRPRAMKLVYENGTWRIDQ